MNGRGGLLATAFILQLSPQYRNNLYMFCLPSGGKCYLIRKQQLSRKSSNLVTFLEHKIKLFSACGVNLSGANRSI